MANCDVCFQQGAPLKATLSKTFGPKVAPDIASGMLALAERGFELCARCKAAIRGGSEADLRAKVAVEILASEPPATVRPAMMMQAEVAITLASWAIAPWKYPAYTPGFRLLNAVMRRFARAHFERAGAVASILERDLGHGVVGVFTVVGGAFIIENFVSTQRGNGNASRALQALCDLADENKVAMGGAVESNVYGAFPDLARGLNDDALFSWYRRFGFERISADVPDVLRKPRTT